MILWLIIASLALVAAFLIYVPASGERGNLSASHDDDRAFYERRLLDIELDLQEGRISADDSDAISAEAARKLISLSQKNEQVTRGQSASKLALLAAFVFVPVFSVILYSQLGRPNFSSVQQSVPANASLETMIKAAENRLEKMPDDVQGWQVLAPVYKRLGRYNDAINANQNLIRLSGRQPELLFALGEAIVLKNDNKVQGEAVGLFSEILDVQPNNPGALYYSGLGAAQSGNEQDAKSIWISLLEQSEGNEPWVVATVQNLQSLGMKDSELQELAPQIVAAEQIRSLSPEERSAQIEGMVASLAAKLEADPNDRNGWLRLIRSQIVLGKNEDAKQSAQKAIATFPNDDRFAAAINDMLENAEAIPAGSEN